jgi:hypothetical protein
MDHGNEEEEEKNVSLGLILEDNDQDQSGMHFLTESSYIPVIPRYIPIWR